MNSTRMLALCVTIISGGLLINPHAEREDYDHFTT